MKRKWNILVGILLLAVVLCASAWADEPEPLTAPQFSITGTTYSRGELIYGTLGNVAGADYYKFDARDTVSNEIIYLGRSAQDGDIAVSSAKLPAGSYILRAYGMVETGQVDAEGEPIDLPGMPAEIPVTITPYAASQAAIIRMSKSEMMPTEWTRVSVYAPGAVYLNLVCLDDPDVNWWANGDIWDYNIRMDVGEHRIYAEAYFSDGRMVTTGMLTLTVNLPQEVGSLGQPTSDLPGLVVFTAGQDLPVNYAFGAEANTAGIDVVYGWALMPWEDYDTVLGGAENLTAAGGTFTVDGNLLEAGQHYLLQIYTETDTPGYPAKTLEHEILAVPDVSGVHELSLSADGATDVTIQNYERLKLQVHAPGARAVHFYRGNTDEWEFVDSYNGFQMDTEVEWEYWTEGTFALYVEACYDEDPGDEQAEWVSSAPVIVHVTTNGEYLPRPEFTVPSTVQIGDILEISNISLHPNTKWCWANIYPISDDGTVEWGNYLAFADILDGTIYLATNRMQPGHSYMISMGCSAPGWLDSRATYRVIRAQGTAIDDDPFFTVIPASFQTSQNIVAMGYVPDAVHVRAYCNGNQDDTWSMAEGSSFTTNWWKFRNSGTYHMTLSACYTEDWDTWDDWTDIETLSVVVSAPYGALNVYGPGFSPIRSANEDWPLTFSTAHAESIEFDLRKENCDGWYWYYSSDETADLIVPGRILTEGVYYYRIDLHAMGYESAHLEGSIVVPGQQQDPNITMTVTPANPVCAEEFTIAVNAPGATAVSLWMPGRNEYFDEGSSLEVTEVIRKAGAYPIYARACYEPLDENGFDWYEEENWGPISAVRELAVTAPNGQAGLPTITGLLNDEAVDWDTTLNLTISGGAHADFYRVSIHPDHEDRELFSCEIDEDAQGHGGSVSISTYDLEPGYYRLNVYVAGEEGYDENSTDVYFRLIGGGMCGRVDAQLSQNAVTRGEFLMFSFPEAQHATWYNVRILDENWNEWYDQRFEEAGTHGLPTVDLEPGIEYRVMIESRAPGFQSNESRFRDAMVFTVIGDEFDGICFRVSKTAVEPCENLTFSVYAPGAESVQIFEERRKYARNDGETLTDTRWIQESGIYSYIAAAKYPSDENEPENWRYSDSIQIVVGDSTTVPIDLAELGLYMPTRILPNEDLTISWQDIGLYHYDVSIYCPEREESVWHSWKHRGETSVTVPCVMPDDPGPDVDCLIGPGEPILEEGYTYQVNLHFYKRGYDSVHINRDVVVLAQNNPDLTLTVGGSTQDLTALINTGINVQIDAPDGATAALFWNGYDWDWHDLDENGDCQFEYSGGSPKQHVVYAKYALGPAENDGAWENHTWSGLSNPVAVQFISNGFMPEADVTLQLPVDTGSMVTFTVNNTAALEGYMWTVRDPVEEWEWEWEDWYGKETVTFNARGLRIGRMYFLIVHSHGTAGYEGKDVVIPFLVSGQGIMPPPQAYVPATVVRGDMLEVNIQNLQALSAYSELRFSAMVYDAVYDEWFGRWYDWDGEESISIPTSGFEARSEPYTLIVESSAAMWEASRVEYTFVVTEPAGPRMMFAKTQVETMEEIPFSLYAPGANALCVTINEEPGWSWNDVWVMDSWGGSFAEGDWFSLNHSGIYELKLYALYGDEAWTYTGVSTSILVTGTYLDLGQYVPATVQYGQNFLIPLPSGITKVEANVWDETLDRMDIYWMDWEQGQHGNYNYYDVSLDTWATPQGEEPLHSGSGDILIPAACFVKNHTYTIELRMYGRGYDTGDDHTFRFTVIDGVDNRVTLTVTLPDDTRNPLIGEDYQVRAYAENASAIRAFNGWNWEYHEGDTLERTWSGENEGTRYLYAQAYFGYAPWSEDGFDWGEWDWNSSGLDWTGVSNIVELTFETLGQCGKVDATLAQTQVTRGDFLTISFPEASYAVWYDVRIRDEDWNDYFQVRFEEPGTYQLPTSNLNEGTQYLVLVSTGAPGHQWNESSFEDATRFTVTEPTDASIRFAVSPTAMEVGESLIFSVYAPGSDSITVFDNQHQINSWDGTDSCLQTYKYSAAGTYTLRAAAHYPAAAGEMERWANSDPIDVVVGGPDTTAIDQSALAFTMPSQIAPDEDLTISWQDLQLDEYELNIYRSRDGIGVWRSWNRSRETSVTIPHVMPSNPGTNVLPIYGPGETLFEGMEAYTVDITFSKKGYNPTRIVRQFAVIGVNPASGFSLTVGGSQDELTIAVRATVRIQIDAPDGATAARFWDGYNWQWQDLDEHGNAELSCRFSDMPRRILYALYTMDNVEEYNPWDTYSWVGPSNLVTVTPIANGSTAAPEVSMPSEVPVGTTVSFSVQNPFSFDGFSWIVYDPVEDWDGHWENWLGQTTHSFSTRDLKIGRIYILKVQSHGSFGLLESMTEVPFTVTGEGVMPAVPASVPANVVRGEMLVITLQNAQALNGYQNPWLEAIVYDPQTDEYTGMWYAWDGGDTIRIPTANLEAREDPYSIRIETGAAGWETRTDEYSFAVTESTSPRMSFGKTLVETLEEISFSAYVPNASAVAIVIDEGENWNGYDAWMVGSWNRNAVDGDSIRFEKSGSYELSLYAQYGTDTWVYTGLSTTIQVTGVSLDLRSMVPATLAAGESFMIELPNGITGSNAEVFDETCDGQNIYWMNWAEGRSSNYNYFDTDTQTWEGPDGEPLHGGSGTIHIPASYLKVNHTYRIAFKMSGRGYNTSHADNVWFMVVPGVDNRVTLTVTLPDDSRNLLYGEEFEYTAHAEGATAIRVFNGWYWRYEPGDTLEDGRTSGDPGTTYLYAQAYFGNAPWSDSNFDWDAWEWESCGFEWSGISNIVELTVDSLGYTGPYDFTDHHTVTAKQGEVVSFTFTESEHANNYWVDAFHTDWGSMNPSTCWQGRTVYMSTAYLPEGIYTIRGRAGARVGYEWSESTGSVTLIVENAEPFGTPTMQTPFYLTTIEEEAFEGTAAQVVVIGDGVESIGDRAFANAQLEHIYIPYSVSSIGTGAFDSGVEIFGEFTSYAMTWALDNGFVFYERQ